MSNAFKHGFKPTDIEEIHGFTKCLNELVDHIKAATGFKPENRYIDSVAILDRISDTLEELKQLQIQAAADLEAMKERLEVKSNLDIPTELFKSPTVQ